MKQLWWGWGLFTLVISSQNTDQSLKKDEFSQRYFRFTEYGYNEEVAMLAATS